MQDIFEVKPELLREQSSQLRSIYQAYNTLFDHVASDLQGINSCWSDLLSNNFSVKITSAQKAFHGELAMLANASSMLDLVATTAQDMDTEWAIRISGSSAIEGKVNTGEAVINAVTDKSHMDVGTYMSKATDTEYAALCSIFQKTVENWENNGKQGDLTALLMNAIHNSKFIPENDPLRYVTREQLDIALSADGLAALTITNGDNALVVFGGTNFSELNDIATDANIATGKPTAQALEAISLVKAVSKKHANVTVTGHSLGGYLATTSTMYVDGVDKCVAFDPPGSWYNKVYETLVPGRIEKVTTYEVRGSIVSAVGSAAGDRDEVPITGDPLYHSIDRICESMGGREEIERSWNRA